MMLGKKVQTILVVLVIYLQVAQAVVQFSFNKAELAISEGGDLPSQLSILKSGETNQTIIFQVRVIPSTARESEDYISNSATPYVFTNDTSQQPIRTQLVGDRSGEPIENFMICLPDSQTLQSMGAEAVQPTCVTITIVDDDSVVIGFKNMFEAVTEGGTISVCAEVKPEGLMLDPFDRIPLSIRTNPASSEAQLNTNSLVFEMSINERCGSVSVADNNIVEGSRSYQLILEKNPGNTVPVELYPSNIPIIVVDNDGPDANFSFSGPQLVFVVQEGDRIDNIQVQKSGYTVLSYNVSLMVMPLTDSASPEDVVITKSLLFNPSMTLMDVGPIEIRNDALSERRKEFNISIIDRIEPVNYNIPGIRTTVQGDPIKIIAYDDDYEVGFDVDDFDIMLTEGASKKICVSIRGLQSSDINPTTNIPLSISTSNISAGCLELKPNRVVLNSVNISRCFMVIAPTDNKRCNATKHFTLQLTLTGSSNMDNTITLQGGNINIVLQDPSTSDNRTAIAVGITVLIVCTIISLVVAAVLIAIFILRRNNNESEEEKQSEDLHDQKMDSEVTKGSHTGSPPPPYAPPDYKDVINESNLDTTSGTNQEGQVVIEPETPPQSNPGVDENSSTVDNDKPKEGYSPPEPVAMSELEADKKSSPVDSPNNIPTSTNITDNSAHGNDDGTTQDGGDRSSTNM